MGEEAIKEEQQIADERLRAAARPATVILRQHIRALSTLQPAVTLEPQATVREAIAAMQQAQTSCVLIVDHGQLVGMFTERDVVHTVAAPEHDLDRLLVREVMQPDPDCLGMDDELAYALHHMIRGDYRHIPVVDDQRQPLALLSMPALMAYLGEAFPQEILNLPPSPAHSIAPTREGA
jgi:CBS domain-containing protein